VSENKAIEFLTEFHISPRDLDLLSVDRKATLSILSFAVSEVNVLMKTFLLSSHSSIGTAAIDQLLSIQRNTILRVWSAKVFEFSEFLKFGGKKKETSDEILLKLSAEQLEAFDLLKHDQGFSFAQNIRHESTNHYSFSAAKDNVKHLAADADCNAYMHEMTGNSFYPMGEHVMFITRISRQSRIAGEDAFRKVIQSWLDWLLRATEWMEATFAKFFEELVLDVFPGRSAYERMYWIAPELVGKSDERKVPVFLRKKDS
jgi:hypothetical protein